MKEEVRDFDFITLFDTLTLTKAVDDKDEDDWTVYIEATNDIPDFEGEAVQVKAIEEALGYFLEDGKLTWEHVTKDRRHDPSIFIGEPLDAGIKDGRLFVKARLLKHVKKAQEVWDILRSNGKLKASIGGFVKERKEEWNRWAKKKIPTISKFHFNHLAITPWPINQATKVQMVPFGIFAKSLWSGHEACENCTCESDDPNNHCEYAKALTTGGGLSPSTMTGGRALIPEFLDPKIKITADANKQEEDYCTKHQLKDGSFKSRKAFDEHFTECVCAPLTKSLEVTTMGDEIQGTPEEQKGLASGIATGIATAFAKLLKSEPDPEDFSADGDEEDVVVVNDVEGIQKSLNTIEKLINGMNSFNEALGKAMIGIAQRVDELGKSVSDLTETVVPVVDLSKSTADEIHKLGETAGEGKARGGVDLAKEFDTEDTELTEIKPQQILTKAMSLFEKGQLSSDDYHRVSVGVRQSVNGNIPLNNLPVFPLVHKVQEMVLS